VNRDELASAKDPDLRSALAALRRAALLARKTAIQTGTHLVIVQQGRLQRVSAAELVQQEANKPNSG
jgi:hypothetical protein